MPVATATKVTRSIPFPIGGRSQYGRKSKRDEYSRSVKHQLKEEREFFAQEGWPVDPSLIFSDDGISASEFSDEERQGYDSLIAAIRARRVWYVLVTEVSRLTRDLDEGRAFTRLAGEVGSLVVETTNGRKFDLMTNAGRHDFIDEVNKASRESGQTSERVTRNKRESAEEGRYHGGGLRPYGRMGAIKDRFARVTNTGEVGTKIIESEAEVINWWGDLVLDRWPLMSIAQESKRRGIVGVTGKPFTKPQIRHILQLPHLIGRRLYKGRLYPESGKPLAMPPIMEDEKYRKIQLVLNTEERLKGASRKGALSNELTGWLYCGGCGNKMSAHRRTEYGTSHRTYVCRIYDDRGNKIGCGRRRMAEPVELFVEDQVLYRYDSPAFAEALHRALKDNNHSDDDLARLLEQEEQIQQRLYELEAAWTKGTDGLDLNSMLRMKAALEKEQKDLTAKMTNLTRGRTLSVVLTGGIHEIFQRADLHQRRMFIGLVVERITIEPQDPHAPRKMWLHERSGQSFVFNPNLVVIDWKF